MSRRFRLGEASNELQAAAVAWSRTPRPTLLRALKYAARRFARELARMRELNAGAGR
jgi:hypothetical protein